MKSLFVITLILALLIINNSLLNAQCPVYSGVEAVVDGGFENNGIGSTFGSHVLMGSPEDDISGINGDQLYSNPGVYFIGVDNDGVDNDSLHEYFNFGGFQVVALGEMFPVAGNKMMMVDAASDGGVTLWEQSINVIPSQTYYFSAFAGALYARNLNEISFIVNDGSADEIVATVNVGASHVWEQFFGTWESGVNTSATIRLVTGDVAGQDGNDFAIDEISFINSCLNVTPDYVIQLPSDTTYCTSIVLDPQMPTDGSFTYTWFYEGDEMKTSTTDPLSPNIDAAGEWVLCASTGNNCVQSHSVNVTFDGPVMGMTLITPIACNGNNDAAIYTNTSGGLEPYNYVWSHGNNQQNVFGLGSNTYIATVTDFNGCKSTLEVEISEPVLLEVSLAKTDEDCEAGGNGAIDISATGGTLPYDYLWSNAATNENISGLDAAIFTVVVTDDRGCTVQEEIAVFGGGTLDVSLANESICDGKSATFDPGTFDEYLWSNGLTAQTIVTSIMDDYTVTVTNAGGCVGVATATLTVTTNPIVVLTNASICQGNSMILDAGSGYVYNWSTGESTQTIAITNEDTYTVIVTDIYGCTGEDDMELIINEVIPPIVNDQSICEGVDALIDPGAGYSSYEWSNGESTQVIVANIAGTYTITVVEANGCSSYDDMILTVNQNPVITVDDNAICEGQSYTADVGEGYDDYNWSTSETTSSIVVTNMGSYSVTVTDVNGCSDYDGFTLIVYSNPVVVIDDQEICAGNYAVFDPGAGYAAYEWPDLSAGQTLTTGIEGTYTVTVTNDFSCTGVDDAELIIGTGLVVSLESRGICEGKYEYLDAGTFPEYLWSTGATTQVLPVNVAGDYTVTVSDGQGCTGSDNANLIVKSLPIVTIDDVEICEGSSATLDAGSGFVTYAWNIGGSDQTVQVDFQINVYVSVTDMNGCEGVDDAFVIVGDQITLSMPDHEVCEGENISVSPGGFDTYNWNTGENSASIDINLAGTYSVTVANGICDGKGSFIVAVNPIPVIDLGYDTIFTDWPDTILLDAGPGFASYNWSNGARFQTVSNLDYGTYTVTVTDVNSCSNTVEAQIEFFTQIRNKETLDILIFPNPTSTILNIVAPNTIEEYQLNLYDIGGRLLPMEVVDIPSKSQIDVSRLPNGTYFIEIKLSNGVFRKLIIKQ